MATITLPEAEVQESKKTTTKYVYFFGGGKAEGHGKMKDDLGGKGAGLAEMTNAGLPVPPGFTIQTEACREYMRQGDVSKEVDRQMEEALAKLEALQSQKLGTGENPLLVSVRSGAKFSMPGMMDTILNLGLNDKSVEALAKRSNNPRFAADSYRRLIQMFGNVVLEIPKSAFDEVFDAKKKQKKTKLDTDLDAKALNEVIEEYKKVVKKHAKRDFPQDPHEQLVMARDAVFRSWQNERAKHYRRINNIDDMLGTAVNVQAMGYGRGLHAQSRHGREGVLRRISDERTGRRRGFGRAYAGADPRTAEDHARCVQPVARDYNPAGKPLPRHAGLRIYDPRWQALYAADAQR
jgi:pyruvate,orthophosphate dikinase